MTKLLLIPIVVYLTVVALMYVGQRSLLYLPGNRAATATELDALGLRRWPEDERYRGYLRDASSAEATIVVFHGNAGDAIDRHHYVDALGSAGTRLLLAEYPGYGARSGRPSEALLIADARETLVRLRDEFPNEPLYVVGESLGAAVAAGAVGTDASGSAAAAPPPLVDALAMLTPWSSLTDVAAHHYRWLPVRQLLKDRYPSARRLETFGRLKIVVVAERDEVVPARFGRTLFDALPEPKALLLVDARHNDWFGRVDQSWWRSLRSMLDASRD